MYEKHKVSPEFPIIFHKDFLAANLRVSPHWHENLELLHILDGTGRVLIGTNELDVQPGDTIIVNTNSIHQISPLDGEISYYCLIIGASLLDSLGIDLSSVNIKSKISDENIAALFSNINYIYDEKPVCYKTEICANAIKIISLLIRNHQDCGVDVQSDKGDVKAEMVKRAVLYMKKNYENDVSLDEIASYVNFSKCYFCRTFKEVTGITVITMLNTIRCEKAKHLLASTKYNISEVAEQCGFSNTSYFTKTYKRIIGYLPSQDIKKQKTTE